LEFVVVKIYNIAIIGAGQLGSRHLQGLSISKHKYNVYIVDTSAKSLNVAEARANEVDQGFINQIFFCNSIIKLPESLDLVIVATLANVRRTVVENLVAEKIVKNLILEKIVFQNPHDFQTVESLIIKNMINVWVNCPRRSFPVYKKIKTLLKGSSPIKIIVTGYNWGMACNSIHFIDLLYFLGNGCKNYFYNIENLQKTIIESKRSGYQEMYGLLSLESESGNKLTLIDKIEHKETPLIVQIMFNKTTIEIDETMQKMKIVNNEHVNEEKIEIPFQSNMTGQIVDQILTTGESEITSFAECIKYHVPMLKAFNKHFSVVLNNNIEECPIT